MRRGFLFHVSRWAGTCCLLSTTAFAQPNGFTTDPYYFRDAPKKLHHDLQGVLTILIHYDAKPSHGLKHLSIHPKPNASAKPDVDCVRITPQPINEERFADTPPRARSAASRQARAMQVCGMRLLGWTADAPMDRIQLPVTAVSGSGSERWVQIIQDPEEDSRGWIHYETAKQSPLKIPLMEYQALERWLAANGTLRKRPYRAFGALFLKNAPYANAPMAQDQPLEAATRSYNVRRIAKPQRVDESGIRLRYLGIQGNWIRVEEVTTACRSEEEGMETETRAGSHPPCAAGWVPWRDADGELLFLPADPPR